MVIDDRPPEKPTTPLSKEEIHGALLKKLQDTLENGIARLSADIGLVADDLKVTKDRIIVVESRVSELEGRITRNSTRVRENSEQDLGQDKAIAQIHEKVGAIEKKTDAQTETIAAIEQKTDAQTELLERIAKLAANPIVKQIATAVGTAVLTWMASRGLK